MAERSADTWFHSQCRSVNPGSSLSSRSYNAELQHPGAAVYAIFIYDFGEKEHCFSPVSSAPVGLSLGSTNTDCLRQIRRYARGATRQLFTLSDKDREALGQGTAKSSLPKLEEAPKERLV
jgi:hypothetical protein